MCGSRGLGCRVQGLLAGFLDLVSLRSSRGYRVYNRGYWRL